jgi:uncharacterized protein YndB with AHSA1/START domain
MNSVTLWRRIVARPSIVFEALTTAEGIAAWWGPDELPVVRADVDARVGGTYRVRFRTLDGRDHPLGSDERNLEDQPRRGLGRRFGQAGPIHGTPWRIGRPQFGGLT